MPPFWDGPTKKKTRLHFYSLALLQQARLIRHVGYLLFFTVAGVSGKKEGGR